MKKEKEFNLSEKRKELRKKLRGFNLWILDEVEEQDKEFIKRLKKGLQSKWDACDWVECDGGLHGELDLIDKLAGDDLK